VKVPNFICNTGCITLLTQLQSIVVTNLNVKNVNQPSTIQVVLQNQEKGVNQIEDARQSTSTETNQSEQIQVGQLQVWNDVK
jgi:hypothetical protein